MRPFSVVLLCLSAGCGNLRGRAVDVAVEPAASFAEVRGSVTDYAGMPVAGAAIEAGGRSTFTDAEGRFRLCRLPPGEIELEARAGQWSTGSTSSIVLAGHIAETSLRLSQSPVPTLTGDSSGAITIVIREIFPPVSRVALYVVDGEPILANHDGCTAPRPGIRMIDDLFDELRAEDIAEIYVLKGPAAVLRYGPEAASGVIVITTRRNSPH